MSTVLAALNSISRVIDIRSIAESFFLADFFDVLIIAVLVYTILVLFKKTRSLLVLVGIGITIVLYVIAQIFQLYLTSLVLQSFFAAFFIIIVILFQEEFRRLLESLALWGTRRSRLKPLQSESPVIDEIVHAFTYLASRKIGALIVIHGKEHLERHIEGGKMLDAVISEELLLSIFDPSSPGHDGAVVIEQNRLAQFGGHLPLSNNFHEIGKHGTRHSAALGISEQSDALAIVVSEERGTISVAEQGVLMQMRDAEAFKERLVRFLAEHFPETSYTLWQNLIRKNIGEKVAALAIALGLWFFFAFPS